jgi:hypothetical protein
MAEEFVFHREGKLLDYLEGEATEWMEEAALDFYGVDDVADLTADHIQQLHEYSERDQCPYYASLGIRNLIDSWEAESDS